MVESVKINVLWVDDIPSEGFMNEAFEHGLDITSATSVNSGLAMVNDKSKVWDAIILDANCKLTDDEQEQPSLKALKEAINQLVHLRTETPWFVYTGGDYEGVEHLEFMIKEREYDDRLFYEKPKQRYELFDNIKKAVANKKDYLVRQKYADVCKFYKDADLVDLLSRLDDADFSTDKEVPNVVRQIMEWIMRYFEGHGLLSIEFKGTNIAECSSMLSKIPRIVPIQVIRSLHFCSDVCNNGSHRDDVTADIVSGNAPYLNKSIILNLLNILQWCPSIQRYEKAELTKKVKQHLQETIDKKKSLEKNKNKNLSVQ